MLPFYQIDAFTRTLFSGNPAAVVLLEEWLDADVMQAIAAENNLSETAFVVPMQGRYGLRWFTPSVEVDLCGHATMAAAWAVFDHYEPHGLSLVFSTLSGELTVTRESASPESRLHMDFPLRPGTAIDHQPLAKALKLPVCEAYLARDLLVILPDEADVQYYIPDFEVLAQQPGFGVILSAPSKECDFVSRFFAPAQGIPEDPVTGSAHCTLAPYWQQRLNKASLSARQLSHVVAPFPALSMATG